MSFAFLRRFDYESSMKSSLILHFYLMFTIVNYLKNENRTMYNDVYEFVNNL
jgi:hypothetical protein